MKLSEEECTHTEIVRTTIAVDLIRYTMVSGDETWYELAAKKVACIGTDLPPDEQGHIVQTIMESHLREVMVNGLLDAVAGKDTVIP